MVKDNTIRNCWVNFIDCCQYFILNYNYLIDNFIQKTYYSDSNSNPISKDIKETKTNYYFSISVIGTINFENLNSY